MPEGQTTILVNKDDENCLRRLQDSISLLSVGDLEEVVYDDQWMRGFSFEHNGAYDESKLTKIIKSESKVMSSDFLRAVHTDEYGTEIFWIFKDGKFKKYEHEQDSQGPDIVKAYRHWHADMEGLWFGGFSEDEINIMAQKYGQFDQNGRKAKYEYEDYKKLIGMGEDFLHMDVRAPYPSSEWDYHIPVYESFARYYAEKSHLVPESGTFEYVRNYYFPKFLGYAWRWMSGGQEVVLLLTFPGDLGMDRNLIVNTGKLTIDQLIILDAHGYLTGEARSWHSHDFNKYVETFDPFDMAKIITPSTDYLYQSLPEGYGLLRREYNFNGMTMNISCDLERGNDGRYFCSGHTASGREVLVTIFDKDFCEKLDALPPEKYIDRTVYDRIDGSPLVKRIIYCEIQAVFDENLDINKVLKGCVKSIVPGPKKSSTQKVFTLDLQG
ncbi:hypothetical protein [Allohahella sp. A8]|uniref:hypothetical protein n=1 Tax=Allohahella sp. A8 TaxID=3141461 RepID=UPI003A7FD739